MRAREFVLKEVGLTLPPASTSNYEPSKPPTNGNPEEFKAWLAAEKAAKQAADAPAAAAQRKAQVQAMNDEAKAKSLGYKSAADMKADPRSARPAGNSADDFLNQFASPGVPKPKDFKTVRPAAAPPGGTPPTARQTGGTPTVPPALPAGTQSAGTTPRLPGGSTVVPPSNTTQPQSKFAAAKANATDIEPKSVSSVPPSAPTLGKPAASAARQNGQDILKNLAKTGITPGAPQNKPPQGFFGGLAQGFKQGMGMDKDRSFASNLASAGLNKVGLGSTGDTLADMSARISDQEKRKVTANTPPVPAPGPAQMPKPGQTIKDPITGRGSVKVMPNPGGKGVKLDTTKSLGYPIIIDPKDLA